MKCTHGLHISKDENETQNPHLSALDLVSKYGGNCVVGLRWGALIGQSRDCHVKTPANLEAVHM
eukprot:scaffold2968_cov321-Pinguiococcus_pyrenoidosus.AAC.3